MDNKVEIVSKREDKSYAVKIIAEENGSVLGWAYLYIIFNEQGKGPYGFLEDVFVNEENRGKGIGTQLVQAVIAEAKKIKCYKIVGTSRYERPEVHAMYTKLGFKDYGKEFKMYL
ncbi:hypothetical protein A2737_01845 [Candidatus Nomurabacteria bacterium RIFCSPHIGHO2_01_FULL_41_71]|nr:MAG: hypothetical protein A2737_01845 [Candidatus Nomurabacteria bacterium RIFCSPHIGHO2_01_FULL_41_71]OGI90298.1 MAG: hypothetical protein A3B01_01475 [Candidatus Nomurabacteria bacterium RIFCSPLOWO2_01_FULL_41_52b]OGJ00534.1 MAG: hypothetical protein A3I90_00365 [Candidatus Nomurabacteria bacterium RIFCSPLOWO2_02_FULL_41_9]